MNDGWVAMSGRATNAKPGLDSQKSQKSSWSERSTSLHIQSTSRHFETRSQPENSIKLQNQLVIPGFY